MSAEKLFDVEEKKSKEVFEMFKSDSVKKLNHFGLVPISLKFTLTKNHCPEIGPRAFLPFGDE